MKKEIVIRALDMGTLGIGKCATMIRSDGSFIRTSPVVNYSINTMTNVFMVETTNTVYRSCNYSSENEAC